MKRITMLVACLLSTIGLANAQKHNALWLRNSQISPDGKSILFTYGGDIYSVSSEGAYAHQLTTNSAYDSNPIWSPDGTKIAFSSDREGSDDVYIMDTRTGKSKRLTFASGAETPRAFLDNETVLFSASVMADSKYDMRPGQTPQIYAVKTDASRPKLYSSHYMGDISISPNGEIIYTDLKGYEDAWRKHEKASISRDIWHRSADASKFTKLTNYEGEDRNAVYSPDFKGFYYLSERSGDFNIFYKSFDGKLIRQVTRFSKNPVRFLSIAKDGTMAFTYDGEIYTMKDGDKDPKKLDVFIIRDDQERAIKNQILSSNLQSFALSPNEKELAYIVRGDVYVVNIEYGTTKRITNTPEQERDISFSKDGRSIAYASERNGNWNIYLSKLVNKDDKLFCYASKIEEEQVTTEKNMTSFTPKFSPDGKEIAFLYDRTEIRVINLASKKQRIVIPAKYQYSYQDGDQNFSWSPDGKWIATDFLGIGGWNNKDLAIFAADGSGKYYNLTESGYSEGSGTWVMGGRAILFLSDRAGFRSHGSWGAQDDVYIMFLDPKAKEEFLLSKEDRAILKEKKEDIEKSDKDKDSKNKDKKSKSNKKEKDNKDKEKKSDEIKISIKDLDEMTLRLTLASGFVSDMVLNGDNDKLYYIATYGKDTDLWELNIETKESKKLMKNAYGAITLAKDGKTLYIANSESIQKVSATGSATPIKIAAPFEWKIAQEREYIFDHTWKQVKDKFYDVNLHGVDWDYYYKTYKKFLPYIYNDRDFAELLSEMLGELNASHTGARYIGGSTVKAQSTAYLGAFFNEKYTGEGLQIEEILSMSPLDLADEKVKSGDIILSIDGEKILANNPIEPMLNGKVGKKVRLSIKSSSTNKVFDIEVKAISSYQQNNLLFNRWIAQREALVEKWGQGKIAYVYVPAMNSASFRKVFKKLLGKYRNYEAVVVDTRFNGGGWLHDDLAILLGGKHVMKFTPRGRYIGSDPFMQWGKASIVLQNEGNYSNGHGFPWLYKELNMGKLIGTPVPGTMTAVWWEVQFNDRVLFGIPQVTCEDNNGNAIENVELQPDILVYNSPEDYINSYDRQLHRSVEELLKGLNK